MHLLYNKLHMRKPLWSKYNRKVQKWECFVTEQLRKTNWLMSKRLPAEISYHWDLNLSEVPRRVLYSTWKAMILFWGSMRYVKQKSSVFRHNSGQASLRLLYILQKEQMQRPLRANDWAWRLLTGLIVARKIVHKNIIWWKSLLSSRVFFYVLVSVFVFPNRDWEHC